MQTALKTLGAAALAVSLGMAAGSGALAKGHGQNAAGDGVPGTNVGAETAGPAQSLGGVRGNGKGPADTPAGANPGNSENAGRD